ncbi:MAG: ATP-dependent Clp protease ATP-binding subunit, partial [Actinobacteria bacterium]|nr:ATP-dependent Clp protease ATP-binding subunit [Actinomycetota bacterium]
RSVLAKFGKDFTAAAQAGGLDPVIGRRQEMERVIEILLRRSKNNPVLVGDAGVGKTAVVEGLAQRIAAGDVPAELRAKRLIALNLPSVIAGTKYRGEFEERIQQLVQEIREAADVILFIDELHTVIGAGGAAGSLDAANMLKSHLARGEVRVIGATTWREYRRYIAGDKSLTRRFQPVEIVEPNEADAVQIMHGLRGVYEDFHGVHIADEAVTMSRRYLTARQLPDKAIDLIDEAAAQAKVLRLTAPDRIRQLEQRVQAFEAQRAATETPSDPGAAAELLAAIERLRAELRDEREAWRREIEATRPTVGKHEVAAVLSKWSGVPLPVLEMTESSRFLGLEQSLQRRIVGQDDALMELGRALRRAVAGLRDPMLPIGSFLMLGETGVGKTETAKALAEFISGAETGLMRVDMSEFSEWHNVSRLVGAPPGYVGYDQAGELTEAVRRSPFSVVLFDDVEKAHPRTLQVLLQIMDDGRLTDANGRHVSFRNTIVVMTSNLGVDAMRAPKIGYGTSAEAVRHHAAFEARMRDEARMHLPAEFLNRIDRVLIFRALSEEDVREITRRALSDAVARAAKVGIELTVTAEALDFLVRSAHARSQGGRPVRQLVGRYVDEPLTDLLVKGQAAGRQVDVQVVAGEPALVDRSRETPSDAEAAALHS